MLPQCSSNALSELQQLRRWVANPYAWAMHLSGEQGAKLLTKLGLIEQAIDYSVETGDFEHAFGLARNSLKSKLPEQKVWFQ